jgi:hypothetical protein
VTPTEEPRRLPAAPAEDLKLARASVTHKDPEPLLPSEIDQMKSMLSESANPQNSRADSRVLQWQPDWAQYVPDQGLVIVNPFRGQLQIVYGDADAPQAMTIPPLASVVTEVIQRAVSITAIVFDSQGKPTDVAVGTLPGCGPSVPGQPPPPPPPPPECHKDVPVVVKYQNATYEPFVVNCITDVDDDRGVGEQKALLDGATPVWGSWTQTPTGQPQFEVHKTQQLPGLDAPAEGPLPGDYRLQLASTSESTSGLGPILLILLAVAAGLGLGAIVVRILRAKPRPPTRVQAVSRPGGPSVVTVRETPAPGEATHAVRLEAHTATGALTIREVDDDHRSPE